MKWLFIIFLLLNVCYFGWELDRQTRIEVRNSVRPFDVSDDVQRLELLKEFIDAPDSTTPVSSLKADEDMSDISKETESEFPNVEDSPLQNIVSMMDQGNVMIEKKLIDELIAGMPEFETNYIQEPAQEKMVCVSFGPFAEIQQAAELSDWLKENEIETNQRTADDEEDQYFWIYLSPGDSKDEAIAAIEDLKGKGVQDYKIINKGNLENAISLGLFSSQRSANRRLNELKDVGYQPIMVPYNEKESIIWVDAKVDTKENAGKYILDEFINGYPSRFNSIPVKCEEIFQT